MSEKDQGDRAGRAQLADFEGLARVYGEAMLRIGRLEERVEQLTAELRALHGQDSHGEAPAPSISQETPTAPPHGTSGPSGGDIEVLQDRDDELRHMRVQMASLANQLANTEGRLNERLVKRSDRRRRKPEHRPWWVRVQNRVSGSRE